MVYLVILLHCLPWAARAGLPVDSSATTVATTALHKEASWEEDCVGQLQLLPEIHRVIPGSATVTLDIIIEPVQVHCRQTHTGSAWADMTRARFRSLHKPHWGLNLSLGAYYGALWQERSSFSFNLIWPWKKLLLKFEFWFKSYNLCMHNVFERGFT